MEPAKEDLLEARRQIGSAIHKPKASVKTMEAKDNAARLKSQITLAKRRAKAFEIAAHLIDKELEETQMAHYTVLFSPTGGTKKAADILAEELFPAQTVIDLCDPAFEGASLTSQDIAIIAIPSYAGRVPCTAAERMVKIRGNGARAILLCVYGNRAFDNTLAEMKDQAEKAGFLPIAAVAALAEHSMVRKVAEGRPDAEDVSALKDMASKIKAKLDSGDNAPVSVPGTVPEKPMGNFGGRMAPKAAEDCTRCGICAERCPTQAIGLVTLEADKGKCIGCMRCIAVCPSGARKMSVIMESLGGVALSVLCANRKENELFL